MKLLGVFFALVLAFTAARADEPPRVPDDIVQMRVEQADYSPSARTLDVTLLVEIAEGWHIHAHEPSLATLIPTTLSVDPPPGFSVGEIEYPIPEELPFGFAGGQLLRVYHREISLRIPLTLSGELSREGVPFNAKLRYQACDDTRCLRPAVAERTFIVKSPLLSTAAASQAAVVTPFSNAAPIERWLAEKSLLLTLFLVALMGLALNLTPCVYPLISVTMAYFGSQSRDRRGRVFVLSLAYAFGIASTFSVLGVTAALSGSLFGRALQHPATLVIVAALMVALALASFGVYSLRPPAWLLRQVGGSSVGMAGALFMGLTMGIVAAPCVGPIIVGLLVAVGTRGDPLLGFLLFFALAIGLSAPYVLLAVAAGSLSRLPRSGEWLVWVEHLFGFVLLGMALYFLSPLLSRSLLAWIVPCFLAVAGLYLGFFDPSGNALRYFPVARQAFGTLVLAGSLWSGLPSGSAASAITWQTFSAAALEGARINGRSAVVDFRADWCLPCLEMERTTFVDPKVTSTARNFAMLRADVTEDSRENEETLSRHEVLGVPTTIFYDRTGKEHRRMIGYISPDDFAKLLEETLEAGRNPGDEGG